MLRTGVSERRLDILEWLKDPAVEDGVTAAAVAEKLGVSRQVAETDLGLLADIGLLRTKRIRRRTYYRRDEMRIAEVARMFEKGW
ncbi:helix-turn-helix domain-containing protein [Streptomyces dysideae]|uniref:ArsR family transcriptional regulator n=1 Tax=Streptomyces dysideae TaxID=909626 RepID=A0A101UPE0_9ACTN|nr:helix-turn-helix domain-containing protein [Streptomyces dysideae]KUO14455.1 ArsR family transcriptional regulator [Streptomyces dysideae]